MSETAPAAAAGGVGTVGTNTAVARAPVKNALPVVAPLTKKTVAYGNWKMAQDVRIVPEDTGLKEIVLPSFPTSKVSEVIMAVNNSSHIHTHTHLFVHSLISL